LLKPGRLDAWTPDEAGIELGSGYPRPMVDLKALRERALEAFRSIGK
jgi:deoxyribodipyrimidine photolyase